MPYAIYILLFALVFILLGGFLCFLSIQLYHTVCTVWYRTPHATVYVLPLARPTSRPVTTTVHIVPLRSVRLC